MQHRRIACMCRRLSSHGWSCFLQLKAVTGRSLQAVGALILVGRTPGWATTYARADGLGRPRVYQLSARGVTRLFGLLVLQCRRRSLSPAREVNTLQGNTKED